MRQWCQRAHASHAQSFLIKAQSAAPFVVTCCTDSHAHHSCFRRVRVKDLKFNSERFHVQVQLKLMKQLWIKVKSWMCWMVFDIFIWLLVTFSMYVYWIETFCCYCYESFVHFLSTIRNAPLFCVYYTWLNMLNCSFTSLFSLVHLSSLNFDTKGRLCIIGC